MKDNKEQYVNMEHVIGYLAQEYNIPILSFDSLIELGKRAVEVYRLQQHAKTIPFADLCEYITAYIQTPFGHKSLVELSS
jgi:hypothetical protein